MSLLFHRRDVAADTTEGLGTRRGAEAATHLLLDLHHPQVSLGQVVIEGDSKIVHERQRLRPILDQPVQQILALALFLSPPPTAGRWPTLTLLLQTRLENRFVVLRIPLTLSNSAI